MSSTAVPDKRDSNRRTADNTKNISKQIIESTKIFEVTSPIVGLAAEQGSNEGSASGNYLAKSGDVKLGPLGNDFRILEIINDTISVSIATPNFVPWIILNPEGGLADDLITIVPGVSPFFNQELVLQNGNAVEDITIKGTATNIITPDGNDVVFSFGQLVKLYYNQLLSAWIVSWVSSGSGGGSGNVPNGTAQFQHLEWDGAAWIAQQTLAFGANSPTVAQINIPNNVIGIAWSNVANDDYLGISVDNTNKMVFNIGVGNNVLELSTTQIDVKSLDVVNIDRAKFVEDSGSVSPTTGTQILLNSNDQFQFNTDEDFAFAFSFDNNAALVLDDSIGTDERILSLQSDSADVNSRPILKLSKTFNIPLVTQNIGEFSFNAGTSAGSGTVQYSAINSRIENVTAGNIEGSLGFDVTISNSVFQIMRLNWATSGNVEILTDLNMATSDIINIDRSVYVQDSGAVSNNTDSVILLNSNNQFQFNTAEANNFVFSFDNEASFILDRDTADNNQTIATIQSDSTNINSASFLDINKAFSIPLSGQTIGTISWKAGTSAGTGLVEYASIDAEIEDNTDGARYGELRFNATVNNSVTAFMQINADSSGLIDINTDLDMNNKKIADIGETTITDLTTVTGAAGDFLMMVDASDGLMKKVDASDFLGGGGGNSISQGDSNVTVTDLGIGSIDMVVDGTSYISLGGGSVIITQNAALQGFTDLQGNVDLGNNPADTISFEGRVDTNIEPSADLNYTLGSATLAWSQAYINRVNFDIPTKFIDSVGSLDLVCEVPSGGDMKFQEAGTEFWRLDGGDNVSVFSRDIELDGSNRAIRAFDGTEIGYFVTNTSASVGTAGTQQMPVVASLTPTVANLDAAFGSEIGCFGLYNTSGANVNMAIKNLAGEWILLAFPDAGGNVISDHVT